MPTIVFDEKWTSDLRTIKKKTKVESPGGEVLGYFTPVRQDKAYQAAVRAWADSVVNWEEIEAAIQEPGEIPTSEVLRKLREAARKPDQ